MSIYTHRNFFHGTSARTRLTAKELSDALDYGFCMDADMKKKIRTARRVAKKLCGMADCYCSSATGIREYK